MFTFHLSLLGVLTLLVATILPILVGLVTTRETSPNRRAIYLAALSVLIGLGQEVIAALQAGTVYDLGAGLLTAIGIFLVAVALHFGLWKPTGVSAAAIGVGSAPTTDTPAVSTPAGE
jgi:hypothetical protein